MWNMRIHNEKHRIQGCRGGDVIPFQENPLILLLVLQKLVELLDAIVHIAEDDMDILLQMACHLRHADCRAEAIEILIVMPHDIDLVGTLHDFPHGMGNHPRLDAGMLLHRLGTAAEKLGLAAEKHRHLVAAAPQGKVKLRLGLAAELLHGLAIRYGNSHGERHRQTVRTLDLPHLVEDVEFLRHGLVQCMTLQYHDIEILRDPAHEPAKTFQPVVDFVAQAAVDPDVLAIKQTLYRVSGNSPIIAALAKAAENGKQVMVLVELKARFDEEHNIGWAKMLEKAGCHVIYGLVGLKTHSKITLVVRREEDGIRRYVHLATGNYNDSTAKLYTDVGMFTCRESYGEDATAVFNMLSGYSEPNHWNRLTLAPLWLKDRFVYLIGREAEHAKAGEAAHIMAKMNSLCDPDIMEALYRASAAGVRIELIVRGICCLRVGIPGISENIEVRSIVGNFLEHSRIFYFENGGSPEVYAASADWMPRNLDRRVEIMFPLEDPEIQKKAIHILKTELADTEQARVMNAEGEYERVDRRGKEPVNSQLQFCNEAVAAAAVATHKDTRVFTPEMAPSEDK